MEPLTNQIKNSDHPDLIVCGYTRKHYRHSFPDPLLSLVESYYTLWKNRSLTSESIKKVMITKTSKNERTLIHIHSEKVHGTRLIFSILIQKCFDNDETKENSQISNLSNPLMTYLLCVQIESDVRLITGKFGFVLNGTRCKPVSRRYLTSELNRTRRHPVTLCERTFDDIYPDDFGKVIISCYLDLTQITFNHKRKAFDLTPKFHRNVLYRWKIEGEELQNLMLVEDDFLRSSSCNRGESEKFIRTEFLGGWKMTLCWDEGDFGVYLWIEPTYLPLDVTRCGFQVVIRYHAGDEIGEKQYGHQCDFFLPINMEKAKDSFIDLQIAIKVSCFIWSKNEEARESQSGDSIDSSENSSGYNKMKPVPPDCVLYDGSESFIDFTDL